MIVSVYIYIACCSCVNYIKNRIKSSKDENYGNRQFLITLSNLDSLL